MEFLVMNQNQKKKKISMRTKQQIQNQTNSRCKTQLWDSVEGLSTVTKLCCGKIVNKIIGVQLLFPMPLQS